MLYGTLSCILTLLCISCADGEIKADFNMAGVSGNVVFQALDSNRTRTTVNLLTQSPLSSYSWEIRELPIITTEARTCDDSLIGTRLHDLTQSMNVTDVGSGSVIELEDVSLYNGEKAILGRTLLLTHGDIRACATIQGPEPLSHAVVNGHIAGNVNIRQIGSRYAVFTDLFSTVSLESSTTTLKVYRGTVNVDLPDVEQQVITLGERCNGVSSTNMVAEVANVPVSGGGSRQRSMQLIETTGFDFSSGWVKLEVGSSVSCANIHDYTRKTVKAIFSREGVQGEITFSQDNPYKPTIVNVNLQNLANNAAGYHIHVFPLPYQYTADTDLCGSSSTGGHFSPFDTSVGSTQDVYEVGDLSGKYGSLESKQNINDTFTDLYVPLFGEYSVVGRSIVIHKPTGARWVCATIGYPGPVIVAEADFNGDVEGTITLVQQMSQPWGDTSVFVKVSNSGEGSEATLSHKYHIHTTPVGDDYLADTGRCSSTGGHWNPYDVAVGDASVYGPTCQEHRLGCEVGDLNGKFEETIDMAASPSYSLYYYTDDIPLSGAYSVINRAITIHQQQSAAPRYVCADIKRKITPTIHTESRLWDGTEPTAIVSGPIVMSSTGVTALSKFEIDIEGLSAQAGGYHIHQFPMNYGNPGDNLCGTTGGHYNPLGATVYDADQSFDQYEIGDLSNKFTSLANLNMHKFQALDTNLPLSGLNSVVGRSIVIHKSTGSRWKCLNTVWEAEAMNGTLYEAVAQFFGDIEGEILFRQVVSTEGASDVNIMAKLCYGNKSLSATADHNWHVHIKTVANSDCGTTTGHYNPFNINVASDGYKTLCGSSSPHKCEYGDLSGKLGKLSVGISTSPAREAYNDEFLDLTGKFSIVGRSIVIHAENGGGPRVACADIVPVVPESQIASYYIYTPEKASFQDEMATTISDSLNMNSLQNVYVKAGINRGNCTAIQVYFSGTDALQMKASFVPESVSGYPAVNLLACGAGVDGEDAPIKAYFNMSAVIGDIEFVEMDNTMNNTKAIINIEVDNWYNWEVREFPVLLSESDPCSDAKLGRRIIDLSPYKGIIDSRTRIGSETPMLGVSLLQGENAILGRSILMKNGNKRACATIQGSERLLHASVNGHVSGTVEVRRVGTRFAVFTNLFNIKSSDPSTTTLRIFKGSILPDQPEAQMQEVVDADRCSLVDKRTMIASADNVPIAAGTSTSLHFTHILSQSARLDFDNLWVKVDIESGYSCGNLHAYETKEVQATFSAKGVQGFIKFIQDDPYKPTNVTIEFNGLDGNGAGYHVHEFPLPYQYEDETDLCGLGSTGGHWNPFGAVGFNDLVDNVATQELYEIGDLSGKHGTMATATDWNQQYTDMFLPLFGRNSIVGRSVVIHYQNGQRFICATIGYPGPVTVAQAAFSGSVFGTITFVQEENKPWSDTSVMVEVVNNLQQETLSHGWHIHKYPVGEDHLAEQKRCVSTGGHWNPFGAIIGEQQPLYNNICNEHRQGCEVGDLSAKLNQSLNLASIRELPEKLFFTDELPLSGGYTIIRRSVVIHEVPVPGTPAPRLACADVLRKLSPAVTTEQKWWGPTTEDTVTGSITVESNGLPADVSVLSVNLEGLAAKGDGYHVHQYPLNTRAPGDNVCGTTGGHFNPFNAQNWKSDGDSFDHYEIGDLSNKFESLKDATTYQGQYHDTNLPLQGLNSIVGRSVVIHDAASRWKCSNTVWDTKTMNATLIEAKADFVGAVEGYMKFSQMMTDEGESDVNIEVQLSYSDGQRQATNVHNWHVHLSPVTNGDCMSTKGHYNPFNIDVKAPSYQADCDEVTPRKCEMGDQSGKLGTIDIGAEGEPKRFVFNDGFLTLAGKYPIIGRSVVIHAEMGGAPRIACADIIPYGTSTFTIDYYIKTPTTPFKDEMADSIKNRLSMDDLNHVYVRDNDVRGGCTAVSVMFTGPRAEQLKTNFSREYNLRNDGAYNVMDIDACDSADKLVSGVTLLISLIVALVAH